MLIFEFYSISHYRSLVAVKRKTASVLGATDTVFDDYEEKKTCCLFKPINAPNINTLQR